MLPNLVMIGAHKAGTTSLAFYLDLHPQIQMSSPKELDFFLEEHNWKKGVDWYASHFHGPEPVHGEASPSYTLFPVHRGIAGRMADLLPDARLLYLLRDPLERMLSHYVHRVSLGWERRPLEEALLDEGENRYLATSRYAMQLEEYLAHFPLSRILVLTSEDLERRRSRTLRHAFEFLGVDPGFHSRRFAHRLNRRGFRRRPTRLGAALRPRVMRLTKRLPRDVQFPVRHALLLPFSRAIPTPVLSAPLRGRLEELLRDDVRRLRRLTGQAFPDWSV